MESLQLAQMLADISDLSAADQRAAKGLVTANKTLPTNPSHPYPLTQDTSSAAAAAPAGAQLRPASAVPSGNRFDKFGRKILTPPAMSRTNSTGPPSSQTTSMPGTPRELDDDVHQASTLMTLYEIRNRLKQQDSTGLKKAREQIDALIAKNKQQQQQQQQHSQKRHSPEHSHGNSQTGQLDGQNSEQRSRPISRMYTYPKGDQTPDTPSGAK